jgi:hypothetical protein
MSVDAFAGKCGYLDQASCSVAYIGLRNEKVWGMGNRMRR